MRSNPMIRKGLQEQTYEGEAMSIKGTCHKTLALISLTGISAIATMVLGIYRIFATGTMGSITMISIVSAVVGIACLVMMGLNTYRAKQLSMIYAITEGVFVGAISLRMIVFFDLIVVKAMILTILAVVFTLLLYKEAPTLASKIRKGVIIMTVSIVAASVVGLIFTAFGMPFVLWGDGLIGIGFSILVTGVAIANLMIDYDNIVYGAQAGLPKHMEWFFATGLLVTIVWVYIQLLNLLAKFASRD